MSAGASGEIPIATLVVRVKADTSELMRTLSEIEKKFAFLKYLGKVKILGGKPEEPAKKLQKALTDTLEPTEKILEFSAQMKESLKDALKSASDITKGTEETGEKMIFIDKEAKGILMRLRWIARDLMRIGFVAGLTAGIFGLALRKTMRDSMALAGVWDDVQLLFEEMASLIGDTLAPIFELLIPPLEAIRDLLEYNDTLRMVVAGGILLGFVFLSLISTFLTFTGLLALTRYGLLSVQKELSRGQIQGLGFKETIEGIYNSLRLLMAGFRFPIKFPFRRRKGRPTGTEIAEVTPKPETLPTEAVPRTRGIFRLRIPSLREIKELGKGKITKGIDKLRDTFKRLPSIVGKLKSSFKDLTGSFALFLATTILIQPVMEAFTPIFEALSGIVGEVMGVLQPYIDMIADWIENNRELVAGITMVAGVLLALVGAINPVVGIALVLIGVIYLLKTHWEEITAVLKPVIDGFTWLYNLFVSLWNALTSVNEAYVVVTSSVNTLKDSTSAIINTLQILYDIWMTLVTGFTDALSIIAGIIEGTKSLNDLWDLFANIISNFTDLFVELISNLPDMLAEMVTLFTNALIEIATAILGSDIVDAFTTMLGNLGSAFLTFVTETIPDFASDLLTGFVDMLNSVFKALPDWLSDAISGFVNWLVNAIIEKIQELGEDIKNAFLSWLTGGTGEAETGGVQGLQTGGFVKKEGLFYLHAGETVIPANVSPVSNNVTINITATVSSEIDINELAKTVSEEVQRSLTSRIYV